jgi:hypothetical protein
MGPERAPRRVPYAGAVRVPIFQLDAFTTRRFGGNPAAVAVLDRFLDDAVLQDVAAENNLAETAFVVPSEGRYRLRWFTLAAPMRPRCPASKRSASSANRRGSVTTSACCCVASSARTSSAAWSW